MGYIIIILGLILLILCVYLAFLHNRQKNHQNKVHFYVARDKDGKVYLWIGKPLRNVDQWIGYGSWKLDAPLQDFIWMNIPLTALFNLKWEDEPVEVFLNLED